MEPEFKVDKAAVVAAFTTYLDRFDDVVVIGKFRKELRKAEDCTYYVASSTSANKTDNLLNAAIDEWM